jgi:hypothetical protein
MESQSQDEDVLKLMQELNLVRADIIKRHYGCSVVGKQGDLSTIVKFWEVLNMGVNIFLTKPNSVQSKKNTFLLFANSKWIWL